MFEAKPEEPKDSVLFDWNPNQIGFSQFYLLNKFTLPPMVFEPKQTLYIHRSAYQIFYFLMLPIRL